MGQPRQLFRRIILAGGRSPRSSSACGMGLASRGSRLIVAETIAAQFRHRLYGDAGARVHADRYRRTRHPDLCRRWARPPTRQRARAGTLFPALGTPSMRPRAAIASKSREHSRSGRSEHTAPRDCPYCSADHGARLVEIALATESVIEQSRSAHPGWPVPGHRRAQRLRQEHPAPPAHRSASVLDIGSVHAGDDPLSARPAIARAIRMMFQEPRLLPWASRRGQCRNRPWYPECGSDAARDRAHGGVRATSGWRIAPVQWPARSLSGGQKQRVALARALVSGPSPHSRF